MRAAGYTRVSTAEQAEGLSLGTQRATIIAEAARREWELVDVVADQASAKNMKRVGLTRLLERLDRGELDVLIVTRLDRLSRSVLDFYDLLDRANKHGWSVVMMDPAVDMTSPFGRAMAGMAAVFAQLERELISKRQLDSYARRKAQKGYLPPVQAREFDRRVTINRIVELRKKGHGWGNVAMALAIEGHEPPRGEVWHRGTIRRIYAREMARR